MFFYKAWWINNQMYKKRKEWKMKRFFTLEYWQDPIPRYSEIKDSLVQLIERQPGMWVAD